MGPLREDGKHEVATLLQRVDLGDRVALEPGRQLSVAGFREDTLVRRALEALAAVAGVVPAWRVVITKRIPVGAGLGGGSSDAATALRLANATLDSPLPSHDLHRLAASLGADIPFFLEQGPRVARGDGSILAPVDLPQDYWVLLVLPHGIRKHSTTSVYHGFDERGGEGGWPNRFRAFDDALAGIHRPRDLAALPPNDLASSPLAGDLLRLGAFRADVTGAGPAVYGLFQHRRRAETARSELRGVGRTWLTVPVWYG